MSQSKCPHAHQVQVRCSDFFFPFHRRAHKSWTPLRTLSEAVGMDQPQLELNTTIG
jgi:hypothetical protein